MAFVVCRITREAAGGWRGVVPLHHSKPSGSGPHLTPYYPGFAEVTKPSPRVPLATNEGQVYPGGLRGSSPLTINLTGFGPYLTPYYPGFA